MDRFFKKKIENISYEDIQSSFFAPKYDSCFKQYFIQNPFSLNSPQKTRVHNLYCFTLWRQTSGPTFLLQHLTSGCFSKLIILSKGMTSSIKLHGTWTSSDDDRGEEKSSRFLLHHLRFFWRIYFQLLRVWVWGILIVKRQISDSHFSNIYPSISNLDQKSKTLRVKCRLMCCSTLVFIATNESWSTFCWGFVVFTFPKTCSL